MKRIQNSESTTHPFSNEDVKKLNARIDENGNIQLGPVIEEIRALIERFKDSDLPNLFTDLCCIPRSSGENPEINTNKQWFELALQMFKEYKKRSGLDLNDPIDKLILDTDFGNINDPENPLCTEEDVKTCEQVKNLFIYIFGRFTYISMISGMMSISNGDPIFTVPKWDQLKNFIENRRMKLAHRVIGNAPIHSEENNQQKEERISSFLFGYLIGIHATSLRIQRDNKIETVYLYCPPVPGKMIFPHFKNSLPPTVWNLKGLTENQIKDISERLEKEYIVFSDNYLGYQEILEKISILPLEIQEEIINNLFQYNNLRSINFEQGVRYFKNPNTRSLNKDQKKKFLNEYISDTLLETLIDYYINVEIGSKIKAEEIETLPNPTISELTDPHKSWKIANNQKLKRLIWGVLLDYRHPITGKKILKKDGEIDYYSWFSFELHHWRTAELGENNKYD